MSRSGWTTIGGIEVDAPSAIALRAARDDELHDAVRDAAATASRVIALVGGRDPRAAAEALADDGRLRRDIERTATGLGDAVLDVIAPPRRRRRRWLLVAGLAAGVAGVLYVVFRDRLRGCEAGATPHADGTGDDED